jgi:hypothetical protein
MSWAKTFISIGSLLIGTGAFLIIQEAFDETPSELVEMIVIAAVEATGIVLLKVALERRA